MKNKHSNPNKKPTSRREVLSKRLVAGALAASQLLLPAVASAQESIGRRGANESQTEATEPVLESDSSIGSTYEDIFGSSNEQAVFSDYNQGPINRPESAPNEQGTEREQLTINPLTPEMINYIDSTTVLLQYGVGCSGAILRDSNGADVGITTSTHCLERRIKFDADGSGYFMGGNIRPIAYRGQVWGELSDVATIDSFITQDWPEWMHHDVAIATLNNHSPEQVTNAYNAHVASDVPFGQQVFGGAWPNHQPNTHNRQFERQYFNGVYLGQSVSHVTSGREIQVHLVALPKTDDGAYCSFGASGSEAYVEQAVELPDGSQTTQIKSLGNLGAFVDLAGETYLSPEEAAAQRQSFEDQFGVDLSNIAAICGYTSTTTDQTQQITVLRAQQTQNMELFASPYLDNQLTQARQNMFDVNSWQRSYLQGNVQYYNPATNTTEYFKNPYVFPVFNHENIASIIIGTYDEYALDNLQLKHIENIDSIRIYTDNAHTYPHLQDIMGEVVLPNPQAAAESSHGFSDNNQHFFGLKADTIEQSNEHTIGISADRSIKFTDVYPEEYEVGVEYRHMAQDALFNTDEHRIIIDGYVSFNDDFTNESFLVENPYLWYIYDEGIEDYIAVIGVNDYHLPEHHLRVHYIPDVQTLDFFARDNNHPTPQVVDGKVSSQDTDNDGNADAFSDEAGLIIGKRIPGKGSDTDTVYQLSFDANAEISLAPKIANNGQ